MYTMPSAHLTPADKERAATGPPPSIWPLKGYLALSIPTFLLENLFQKKQKPHCISY